ncbi:YihY/virulence factor BrkB family protein [Falsiroseomonas sp. HW251]|uniref:YihY/virulence factor BrkB family protein n=1 Tax=Falsiroseomonas sp. HW251 TaxID=3390998 RepID=UPI003D3177BA
MRYGVLLKGQLGRTTMPLARSWTLLKSSIEGFIADEAMTRGAAIACYTIFSVAPLLVIAIAIASTVFAEATVWGAVLDQLRALVGEQGATAVESMAHGVDAGSADGFPALLSVAVLLITASGVFAEIQSALNVIWKAEPRAASISYLVRARLLSVGLVATTGFLLLVSLLVSAAMAALETSARGRFPEMAALVRALGFFTSFVLTALLFAAIYKLLPDRRLEWRDVAVGALGTAFLFTFGKTLIGWYIGGSGLAQRYGATGALVVVLLWVYYSAQVFLLGAEFTRAWAEQRRHRRLKPVRLPE